MSSMTLSRSRLRRDRWIQFIIPFALLGMMGSAITFLRHICTGDVRWAILGLLLLLFIISRNLFIFFETKFSFLLFLYLSWCMFTSFWSVIPILSFIKSGVFCIVVLTMIRVGLEWIRINKIEKSFDYLWILSLILLISSLAGGVSSESIIPNGNVTMYQGLVRGANMFGTLLAMCLPYFIWKFYRACKVQMKIIFLMCIVCCLYSLFLSFCRSAMLMSLIIISGFILSLNFNKKILITFAVLISSLCVLIISPSIMNTVLNATKSVAFKGFNTNMFYSRETVWHQSYEGAKEGGLAGLGFGISYGRTEFDFTGGLNAYLYSREKGNSQLAIVEETGLISLCLYFSILLILLGKLFILYFKVRDRDHRVLIAILGGTFLGIIAHSFFEGWWTSPGSQESIYFWMLVGIILGMEKAFSSPKRVLNYVKT